MPVERIKLEVEVRINYDNESERKETIDKAKRCVLSVSVGGMIAARPIKAKLLSPDSK